MNPGYQLRVVGYQAAFFLIVVIMIADRRVRGREAVGDEPG